MDYPPSTPPRRPTHTTQLSPSSSPHLTTSPPRSSSLSASANRSPRLGQASFDASLAASRTATPPAYTATPRQLFPDPSSASPSRDPLGALPAASSETLHIMSMSREGSSSGFSSASATGSSAEDDKLETVRWEIGGEEPRAAALASPGRTGARPPDLDLSREAAALPALQYTSSLSSADIKAPISPSPSSSSPSPSSSAAADSEKAPRRPTSSIQPSLSLLFSLSTRRTKLTIVLPAVLLGLANGLVPPYMTIIFGDALQAFTDFSTATSLPPSELSSEALSAARKALLHAEQTNAIKFVCLAAAVFVLNAGATALWVIHGERVARDLRTHVYEGLSRRGMEWFDKGMGGNEADGGEGEGEGGDGAAGLMGRFTKDTDDVRVAASQTIGSVIQYLASFIFCLILSFYRNYQLTFVVLASIPVVTFIVALTERFSGPLAHLLRETTGKCSARVDRIIGAIPTVKAFNAESYELDEFKRLTKNDFTAYVKLHFIWGVRGGVVQFMLMSMFVSGFWFGTYLISTGRASASSVNTCFWACLSASTYLQTCIPLLVTLEKGKIAMASLLELTREEPAVSAGATAVGARRSPPKQHQSSFRRRGGRGKKQPQLGSLSSSPAAEPAADDTKIDFSSASSSGPLSPHPFALSPTTPNTPTFIPLASAGTLRRRAPPRAMGKLRPSLFSGELSLRNVVFHYPTRPAPAPPALKDVSLYFAARETTYVVGTSGSGKSTVGQLLLGLYKPDSGRVEVDEQGLEWIDEDWLRGHVACVSQGASVLFDGTIHDNVAVGVVGQLQEDGTRRRQEDVSREEVVAACRGALIHDFVRDLPEGYDTWISGEKGASLSGGQRQRLAIARAWIRNPTVVILDEATSALDATSRLLVNEAVKRWRENRTTIIITHDLAPIDQDDFVYVMADGEVVEQGYRGDLEREESGPFAQLARSQQAPPEQQRDGAGSFALGGGEDDAEVLDSDDDEEQVDPYAPGSVHGTPKSTFSTSRRPISVSGTPKSVLTTPKIRISDADAEFNSTPSRFSTSLLFPPTTDSVFQAGCELRAARRISAQFGQQQSHSRSSSPSPSRSSRPPSVRAQSTDLLPPFEMDDSRSTKALSRTNSEMSLAALEHAGTFALQSRSAKPAGARRIKHRTMHEDELRRWAGRTGAVLPAKEGDDAVVVEVVDEDEPNRPQLSMTELTKRYWRTIPNKLLFFSGMLISVVVGACTPVFSTFLSTVMANLGASNGKAIVSQYSVYILIIAAVDGAGTFAKFYFLERCAQGWITSLRRKALALVIKQDKAFFDDPQNSTSAISHCIVKDSEDARVIVGTVLGQLAVLVTMLIMGITWAFVAGWELTLVGTGLAPIFIIATRLQAAVLNRYESANKVKRENVSKRFHQTMANIRPIRSMSIEPVFVKRFEKTTEIAYSGGIRAAPYLGFGAATAMTLTYLAQGLMVYVGAVLVAKGRYDFAKVLQVITLILFTVTFAGGLMNYLPSMAKSLRAANDLLRLLELKPETKESEGRMTFPIKGYVSFSDVHFSYPSRPDVPILKGLTFDIQPGECVGIVGASGSGKSTAAALLQRLYEPESGSVLLDGRPLSRVDVKYLRDHVAVVSQHPALFDMTVHDNVAYGRPDATRELVEAATHSAHIHDFIGTLPKGYDTMLGENASLISGGQAQRLQIARALVQPRELLILDECTSALDPTNQKAVLDTILQVKTGRTTLIVTHKLAIMEKCDRLVVVQDGVVAETGSVAELRAKPHGVFAQLASGGEWEAS
ncbi:hypothetical protein JCM10213_004752 [Rhodosporidiobolus nylandii]